MKQHILSEDNETPISYKVRSLLLALPSTGGELPPYMATDRRWTRWSRDPVSADTFTECWPSSL